VGCARIIAISEGWLPKGQGKGGEQGAGLARPSARLLRGFCVRPRSFCNRQTGFFAVLFMAQAGCFSCLCGRGSDYTVRATSRMPGFLPPGSLSGGIRSPHLLSKRRGTASGVEDTPPHPVASEGRL
jgi:hypothetical protein